MNVLFVTGVLPNDNPFENTEALLQSFKNQLMQIGFYADAMFYPPDLKYLALPFAFSTQKKAKELKILNKGCSFEKFSAYFSKKVPQTAQIVVFLHRSDLNYLLFDLTAKQNPFLQPLDLVHVEIYDWFRGCAKLHSTHPITEDHLTFLSI